MCLGDCCLFCMLMLFCLACVIPLTCRPSLGLAICTWIKHDVGRRDASSLLLTIFRRWPFSRSSPPRSDSQWVFYAIYFLMIEPGREPISRISARFSENASICTRQLKFFRNCLHRPHINRTYLDVILNYKQLIAGFIWQNVFYYDLCELFFTNKDPVSAQSVSYVSNGAK